MLKVRLFQLGTLLFIIFAFAAAINEPDSLMAFFIIIMTSLFAAGFVAASVVFEIEEAEKK